jgi:hypothetical protein
MDDLFLDYLRSRIMSTARWRRSLAKRFPTDPRILRAGSDLERLAAFHDEDVDPSALCKIDQRRAELGDDISLLNKEIGFKRRFADINEFLAVLTERLATPEAVQ